MSAKEAYLRIVYSLVKQHHAAFTQGVIAQFFEALASQLSLANAQFSIKLQMLYGKTLGAASNAVALPRIIRLIQSYVSVLQSASKIEEKEEFALSMRQK